MFSLQHGIWGAISICVVLLALYFLRKYKVSLKSLLTIACAVAVASELIKIFSSIDIVSSLDETKSYPYMKMQHLPLHLCSLQILFIFYVRFAKESARRDTVLAFMYPTCLVGAVFALALPSIFTGTVPSVPLEKAFVYPLAYQYFFFHAMLIVLGIYIPLSGDVKIKHTHCFTTMGILGLLAIVTLYINSMFAYPVYEAGKLIAVEYVPNFFFTYETPIGIALTESGIGICISLYYWRWQPFSAWCFIFPISSRNTNVENKKNNKRNGRITVRFSFRLLNF